MTCWWEQRPGEECAGKIEGGIYPGARGCWLRHHYSVLVVGRPTAQRDRHLVW